MQKLENRWMETADAQKHSITGQMIVPITLEDRTKNIPVMIVPSLQHSLILGIDFWNSMQIVTDMSNTTWEFSRPKAGVAAINISSGIKSEEYLSEEEKEELGDFIEKNIKNEDTTLGRTNLVEHLIDTGDATPIKQRYYPMSPARLQEVYDELDKMLKHGVVQPSKSGWSSPIVLIDKPDGTKRFCVNYRKLNSVTIN